MRSNADKCIDLLVKSGADVNTPDQKGTSPLFETIMKGYYNVANALIDAEADVNSSDGYGGTGLMYAMK